MTHATSANTITALRHIFSYFGLPEHLVTDNGTQFTSDEFQKFLRENDILHTLTPPGHPATNGLAERQDWRYRRGLKRLSLYLTLQPWIAWLMLLLHSRTHLCEIFLVHYKLQIPGTLQ